MLRVGGRFAGFSRINRRRRLGTSLSGVDDRASASLVRSAAIRVWIDHSSGWVDRASSWITGAPPRAGRATRTAAAGWPATLPRSASAGRSGASRDSCASRAPPRRRGQRRPRRRARAREHPSRPPHRRAAAHALGAELRRDDRAPTARRGRSGERVIPVGSQRATGELARTLTAVRGGLRGDPITPRASALALVVRERLRMHSQLT